jgi:hypothetical protein
LSAIFTETNVIPEDKNSEQYGARTDSRTDVIKTTPWFYFPYLGKMKIKYILYITGLWCLTPLTTIFQLYRGGKIYWWRKQACPPTCKPLTNVIT